MRIVIPTSQKEVTLSDYQKFNSIIESTENNKERWFKVCAMYADNDGDLTKAPLKQVIKIYKQVETLMNKPAEKTYYRFTFKQKRYGMNPYLTQMTTKEFADACEMATNETLHYLMMVLFRPIELETENHFRIEPYNPDDERAELFKQLPLHYFKGAVVFFSTIVTTYLTEIKNYSTIQVHQ